MLDEYFSVLQFVIMHKSNAFHVNSTDVYAHLQRDQEIIYLTLCTSKVHNNDCGGRTCIILGVREVITGVNVSDKPDRVRARVWGCRPVPHPTGNGADTRQKKERSRQQVGPPNTEPETSSDTLRCLPPRDSGATVCVIRT